MLGFQRIRFEKNSRVFYFTHACVDDTILHCVRGCQVTGKNHGKCVVSLQTVSLCILHAGFYLSLDAEEA